MFMLLLLCHLIAHTVTKAIWGAEEYTREASRPARTKAGQYISDKAKSNPFEGDFNPFAFAGWAACALAWLTGKTLKHGWGMGKAIAKAGKEGWKEGRREMADAKTKRDINKAHEEAQKINARLDLDQQEEPPTPASEPTPDQQTGEEPPADQPTANPAPDIEVEVEVLRDPAAGQREQALTAADIVDGDVVEDTTEHPQEAPASASAQLALTEGETMSDNNPAIYEVQGLPGARLILQQAKEALVQEQAQAEARLNDARRAVERLALVEIVVGGMIDQLQNVYEMDPETIGDAMVILDMLTNAKGAATRGAQEDSRAHEAMGMAVTAADVTRTNMDTRHSGLEEAHNNAPVKAGKREFYTDGQ